MDGREKKTWSSLGTRLITSMCWYLTLAVYLAFSPPLTLFLLQYFPCFSRLLSSSIPPLSFSHLSSLPPMSIPPHMHIYCNHVLVYIFSSLHLSLPSSFLHRSSPLLSWNHLWMRPLWSRSNKLPWISLVWEEPSRVSQGRRESNTPRTFSRRSYCPMSVSAASARPRRPTFWGRLVDSFLCSSLPTHGHQL